MSSEMSVEIGWVQYQASRPLRLTTTNDLQIHFTNSTMFMTNLIALRYALLPEVDPATPACFDQNTSVFRGTHGAEFRT